MKVSPRLLDLCAEADSALIDAVYREILEPAFGEDELDTLECVRAALRASDGHALGLCAVDGAGAPLGCTLGYPYGRSRSLLIGYIAVRPGLRSKGVGGLLLEGTRRWYGHGEHELVLAEIEDPRHHPTARGSDPERRVCFYARHHVQVLAGPYFQPRVRKYTGRVYDMLLAVLHGGTEDQTGAVPGGRVADFLEEYFAESAETEDSIGDEQCTWLFDWYRARDTVTLHPIERYAELDIPRVPRELRADGDASAGEDPGAGRQRHPRRGAAER